MNPLPPGDDSGRLSSLAPEVAAAVARVAGDIALVIDDDGVIRNVAEGGLPLVQQGADWVGRPWVETVTQLTRRKVEMLLQEVQQHGVSRRRELSHPASQGGEIPVSWAAVRLGENGPLLAVGRDLRAVSAIQQRFVDTQQELERGYWQRRQAESHYQLMFQVAHDAVLVLDAESLEVVEANLAATALFEPATSAWAGQALRPLIDRAVRPVLDELLSAARATGRAAEVRLRVAGSGAPIDVSATPLRADGRSCLLLRARRAAAGGPQAVQDFVAQTPDPVVITDSAGRVTWANAAFLTLCQVASAAALSGRTLADVLGDDPPQWAALLNRVRSRGIVGHALVRLQVAGAPPLRAELSAALLAEGDQEHIGFTLRPQSGRQQQPAWVDALVADVSDLLARIGESSLPDLLAESALRVETQLIEAALQRAGGRIDTAAALLVISADSLLLRMRQLGLSDRSRLGADGRPSLVN